eukprot:TRINITY_DN3514_c0_g1_i1.p1 TRINITY_DN3514_c0_g1~~TRINITY_DN3514_c0_g1_i1.p1  ORF type:complete len:950 (-),score=227.67 TRINITY_DN3514_c0_g1_i1:93-2942(-)
MSVIAAHRFEDKLNRALERVRVLLHDTKTAPQVAMEVHHNYDDKYLLVEGVTNAAVASQVNCLAAIGLSKDKLNQLQSWAKSNAVSLQFKSEERCTFMRETTRKEENPTKHVEEVSTGGVPVAAFTSKVVTEIKEYFWKLEVSYEIVAIRGVGAELVDRLPLLSQASEMELKTSTKTPPRPEVRSPAMSQDVNISWLISTLREGAAEPKFKVDRGAAPCKTPRRNPEVDAAFTHFTSVASWANQVAGYFEQLCAVAPSVEQKLDLSSLSADPVFVPVLPLLAERSGAGAAPDAGTVASGALVSIAANEQLEEHSLQLTVTDANRLLAEEVRTLEERRAAVSTAFANARGVIRDSEAFASLVLKHCVEVCSRWSEAVDYIEGMLRKQLIAAIGKEVSPADFAAYMRFHNRKLFKEAYALAPFCFAVRRSEQHTPEGTVSIEEEVIGSGGDSNVSNPIVTVAAKSVARDTMTFPLSASTTVSFGGDRHLHAWLSHKFSGQSGARLSLISRARQFSSMMVLLGRVTSASSFDPKYAAIVQNKDELTIPLELSTIPTPKEFKDAIESLSPEQQSFAKAFRAMQLESTLFGILIVQIKPQLEQVLNLAQDSLTKEIKLTQDLMQLFIKYQIPSDLLSFDQVVSEDGTELVAPTGAERLAAVKEHVKAMNEMIQQEQQEEIEQRRQEEQFRNPAATMAWDPFEADSVMECAAFGGAAPVGMLSKGKGKGASKGRGAPPPMARSARALAVPPPAAPAPAAAPPPPSVPNSAPQQQQVPQQTQQQQTGQKQPCGEALPPSTAGTRDYTEVPKQMDEQFEKLDPDSALRPTIINPSDTWTKKAQKALLAKASTSVLKSNEQKAEKEAAFDLLDALTKSGALPLTHASLHVIVAATQCFDKTVTETIIQENVNPIEKVERSTLIMASTIHQQSPAALIDEAQLPRVKGASETLFSLEDV